MLQYYINPISYEKSMKKPLETIQLSHVEEKTIPKIFLYKNIKATKIFSVFDKALYYLSSKKSSI